MLSPTRENDASSVRILCPIKLATFNRETEDAVRKKRDNDFKNYIVADVLELVEASCDGGTVRRLCSRSKIRLPWTPTLFVAIRLDYVSRLRSDVNVELLLASVNRHNRSGDFEKAGKFAETFGNDTHKSSELSEKSGGVRMFRRANVRALIRSRDRVLWSERRDMPLYELQFDSFRDRFVALSYLRKNAYAQSDDYCLLASSDNFAFEVALSTYVRQRYTTKRDSLDRLENSDDSESEDAPEFSGNSERPTNQCPRSCGGGIDLANSFEMFSWCSVDSRRGNAMVKLSDEELATIGLPKNPLTALPVVSYDIETIAENENAVPRGVRRHQRLSSISLTVHVPRSHGSESSKGNAAEYSTTSVTLMYAPIRRSEELAKHEERMIEAAKEFFPEERSDSLYLYDDERRLLFDAVEMLRNNTFLTQLYRLDDARDAKHLACVLLGYNSWEYDFAFLWCRLHFYGLHRHALALQTFGREPRFCASQISFDLMKHVAARYQAQVGSLALSNVSRFFGANERAEKHLSERSRRVKMNFDAVSIRRLYYDVATGEERFDEETALGRLDPDDGLNALRIWRYNVQDCTAVFHLAVNLAFFDTIALYARHFVVSLAEASHAGNSRLLPNAFALRALSESSTILPYRRNVTAPMFLKWVDDLDNYVIESARVCEPERSVFRICSEKNFSENFEKDLAKVASRRGLAFDERELIRVDDKAYIGGVNSADSSHYEYPISVDFASFYPSIGCQFGLSMETTVVLTVQRFVLSFGSDFTQVDSAMSVGLLRAFDYEPRDNVLFVPFSNASERSNSSAKSQLAAVFTANESHRRTNKVVRTRRVVDGEYVLRGRDDAAAGTLRKNDGWYEGVEFSDVRELVESSVDPTRRRVLVVYRPRPDYVPVIAGLWTHYLSARKRYKKLIRDSSKSSENAKKNANVRVYECMEKMFKVVANSLYGYLNYERSAVYAPTVAAAVTLLSRKTFHETTWICEDVFPRAMSSRYPGTRCRVVYRDTDGLILHAFAESSDFSGESENVDDFRKSRQGDYETTVVQLINETMASRGYRSIIIELDDVSLRLCGIMGKKKYWKVIAPVSDSSAKSDESRNVAEKGTIVTKGFERNAPPYIKHLVRTLQTNLLRYVLASNFSENSKHGAFRVIVKDVRGFFGAVFSSLRRFEAKHGVDAFAFGLKLNPRSTDGAEARFIQRTLTDYSFAIGDRARCLFALDASDVRTTRFVLARDFLSDVDRVNYYKLLRRLAVYLLQTVEGFKRSETSGSLYTSAATFDDILSDAYATWLSNETFGYDYSGLFLENAEDSEFSELIETQRVRLNEALSVEPTRWTSA